jgi:hypothetical protein
MVLSRLEGSNPFLSASALFSGPWPRFSQTAGSNTSSSSVRTFAQRSGDLHTRSYKSRTALFGRRSPGHVHFVGFRGEEYWSAVKVWGRPDFIHQGWDLRARREIGEGDTIVFAVGPHDQQPRAKSFPDLIEPTPV